MKYYKKLSELPTNYIHDLCRYLLENASTFFQNKENECHSWDDFEYWPDKKSDRNHLIMPGEICLIDRMWNDKHAYVICEFYAKCKKVRDVHCVIYIDAIRRSDWKNGYFLLPVLNEGDKV